MDDYLPLRMLNQINYCERRFWYMHVLGEMVENAPVLEGLQQHERAHAPGQSVRKETKIHHRAWLWCDRLRIAGMGDVIEEMGGVFYPVEYKRGRQGRWNNDRVQLCGQAMCIEERFNICVPKGAIFYNASRHRVVVVFDEALRAETEAIIRRGFSLLAASAVPPPLAPDQRARCRECSLLERCMPNEVILLQDKQREGGLT